MTDYRLRVYRKFPHKKMYQVVIYLQPSQSELAWQTEFILEKTRHEFNVIRLWEQPTEIFLNSPGLLPFATLSQTEDKAATLEQVSQQLAKIENARNQSNVAASTAILAGLVLDKELIRQLLRRDFMRESVIYQDILHEGELTLVMRLLRRKFGTVSPALQVQIQNLPLTKLEDLGEDLLDFLSLTDLETWLAQNPSEEVN